jgi:hypothetical protein
MMVSDSATNCVFWQNYRKARPRRILAVARRNSSQQTPICTAGPQVEAMENCQTCEELFIDYRDKTYEYYRLKIARDEAAARGDSTVARALDRKIMHADLARRRAKKTQQKHEREAHAR